MSRITVKRVKRLTKAAGHVAKGGRVEWTPEGREAIRALRTASKTMAYEHPAFAEVLRREKIGAFTEAKGEAGSPTERAGRPGAIPELLQRLDTALDMLAGALQGFLGPNTAAEERKMDARSTVAQALETACIRIEDLHQRMDI